jgi:hypothetical protein
MIRAMNFYVEYRVPTLALFAYSVRGNMCTVYNSSYNRGLSDELRNGGENLC